MELYSETNWKGPSIRNEPYLRKPRNNFLCFDGTVWSQLMIEGITGQYMRFVPFPRVHDGDQSSDESQVIVEAIIGQSKVFEGNWDVWKWAPVKTIWYQGSSVKYLGIIRQVQIATSMMVQGLQFMNEVYLV